MPLAQVGDIGLHYEIRGSGPRLLFIGGTGGDLRRPPTAFDRLLDQHFEVLRFDQRGMGQSGKPDQPYTLADYAADARGLLDALGWTAALPVVGYSFGGMVAQELALRAACRVSRLALIATTAGGAGGASYPLHTLADLTPEARAARLIALSDTRRDAAWQAANPALFSAMVEDQLAAMRLAANPEGLIGARRQLEARRHHDTFARLPQLTMPVAVFAGEHDGVASLDAVSQLARQIPGAVLQCFEGGHLVHVQNSAAARAILAWLVG